MENNILKSPFARVVPSRSTIKIFDHEPSTWWNDFVLKDVTLSFNGNILEVDGQKIEWGFSFNDQWVDEMKKYPHDKYIKFKYRNVKDFFNGIKRPFVEAGWVKLRETTKYHCKMNNWFVVL